MMLKIEVELDDSTLDGWNAFEMIRDTCAAYGVGCRYFRQSPPPDDKGKRWASRPALARALVDKWNGGSGANGVVQSLSPGTSSYHKPPKWLADRLRPLGLLTPDGNCRPWSDFPKPLPG